MRNRLRRIRDDEEGGVGAQILSFWKTVLLASLAFAVMVTGIFISSAISWRRQQRRLELAAKRREQIVIERMKAVSVYTFADAFDYVHAEDTRKLVKMEPGVVYRIGTLMRYDRNRDDRARDYGFTAEDYDRLRHIYGFNCFMPDQEDDPYYADPIFTFSSAYPVRVRYSIDSDDGWFVYGGTAVGTKTGNWQFIPDASDSRPGVECLFDSMTSVKLSANGTNGVQVNADDKKVSDELRGYNYITYESLGEIYPEIDPKYAGRTRQVSTCHLIVTAYTSAADKDKDTPASGGQVVSFRIRIRSYGEWDLRKAEYDEAVFSAPDMTDLDYSPKLTAELVP